MFSAWQISWSTKKSFTFVRWSPESWMTSPTSSSFWTAPLQLKFFLKALQIRFTSKSSARPATVVIHFRPLRCCTRTCTFSSEFPPFLSPASSKASSRECKKEGEAQISDRQRRQNLQNHIHEYFIDSSAIQTCKEPHLPKVLNCIDVMIDLGYQVCFMGKQNEAYSVDHSCNKIDNQGLRRCLSSIEWKRGRMVLFRSAARHIAFLSN